MSDVLKKDTAAFNPFPDEISNLADLLFPDSRPQAVLLALPETAAQTEQLLQDWLHPEEIRRLNSFSLEKRQREWLGGRICAKQSLHLYLRQHDKNSPLPLPQQYSVTSEESGRPHLKIAQKLCCDTPEISISHSKNYATALCAGNPCGIDIQYPAGNLNKVKERFATDEEERTLKQSLDRHPPLDQLVMLWAAKEAVKKMLSPYGMPGFHELVLTAIHCQDNNTAILYLTQQNITAKRGYSVVVGLLDNGYSMALCCYTTPITGSSQSQNHHP